MGGREKNKAGRAEGSEKENREEIEEELSPILSPSDPVPLLFRRGKDEGNS